MSETQEKTLQIPTILVNGDRKYRLVEVLGKGGFGITYLAIGEIMVDNVPTEARFAIKEHFPSVFCSRDGNFVSALPDKAEDFKKCKDDFIAEAKKLHALGSENRNIVKVNEVFEENGTAYYVMQYINGVSLSSYVKSHGKLSYDDAIKLMAPIINAVGFLHQARINHLDIKPDNIMLHDSIEGVTPILIDFGLSVHFKENGEKTSPKNMHGISEGYSPIEQYVGIWEFVPSADIYSLMATLLFCITGSKPKRASEIRLSDICLSLTGKVPREKIDGICKGLNMSYVERTQSISALKSDLGIDEPDSCTEIYAICAKKEEKESDTIKEKKGKKGKSNTIIAIIIALICISIVTLMLLPEGKTVTPDNPTRYDTITATTNVSPQQTDDSVTSTLSEIPEPEISELGTPEQDTDPTTNQTSMENNENNTVDTPVQKPAKESRKPAVTSGTLSLGYATWTGDIKNGKPDGNGRMTFTSAHRVTGTVVAQPGDYIIGTYENGRLVHGKYYDSDGNFIKDVIP